LAVMEAGHLPGAYTTPAPDPVREQLEATQLARTARGLVARTGGGRVLDLGSGGGLQGLLAGSGLNDYTGVDFRPPEAGAPGRHVVHDLREGLGPVGSRPFDLYLAAFGLASHLSPAGLARLLKEITRHARPGAIVAVEALGLFSLEWPRLWGTRPGPRRVLPYLLGVDVEVHPWSPSELGMLLESAGIRVESFQDRSVQAGPKLDEGRYWPGLPPLRSALGALLAGDSPDQALTRGLPPLPAGPVAAVHQDLAARRRALARSRRFSGAALAQEIWRLEAGSGGGFGHGLLVIGRVA
jgi:SAM-dependent methyltransferase